MEPTRDFEDEESAVEMVAKYTTTTTAQVDDEKKRLMVFEGEELSELKWFSISSIHESLESAETMTVRKQMLDEFGTTLSLAFTHPTTYSTSLSSASLALEELTETLPDELPSIAQRLSAMGYLEDCKQIYKTKRLAFFDATLGRFGIQKLSAVEVKRMEWEALDKVVGLWLKALVFCVDLIPIEKQTHQSVFKDDSSALVMGIVRAYVSPFLDFVQAFATTHPSPQKLFRFLDLHRILNTTLSRCVLLEVPRDDPLATQVEEALSQLIEAAKVSFRNFERAVDSDVMHISSVKEGGVHTTTNYVMDYMMRLISEYSNECEWIVSVPRKVEVRTRIDGNICEKKSIDGSGVSPFASHVIWVIASLLRRLKSKTVQHLQDDDAFAHFFMLNNLNYIIQRVNEQPGLRMIVQGDFLHDIETGLRSAKLKYLGSTWTEIVQDLAQCSTPKKIKLFNVTISWQSSRKKTLRNFNEMFGKVHQTQSRWSGSDANLMGQLRKVILDRLVPTYEHLLDQLSDTSGNPTTEIQYSVEDLKKAISQLFQGRPPTSFPST
ncbi:PREDICTED: exocyst complex component EXO70A1-like [Ipomoea nil]|uniref:exocyst complex component EXO70A1-like n=1 Tax=Ipomoea nil TaxID=35883 RepID=UPI000901B4E5|nr:PREDICTED: exocyst complex component EXO70A1-like [Ipomoea nil]